MIELTDMDRAEMIAATDRKLNPTGIHVGCLARQNSTEREMPCRVVAIDIPAERNWSGGPIAYPTWLVVTLEGSAGTIKRDSRHLVKVNE